MKTEKNILIAFLLNLSFSLFEMVGGVLTGSVAILSDAVHDLGDAVSIGLAWLLERKSRRQPDDTHTYGYARYSVLGSVITTLILLLGSVLVLVNALRRLLAPVAIHYDGMIIFAIVGAATNLLAAWMTREGDSMNQKAVNLHMLEDVLGWGVVLVGAVVMRFTDLAIIDPLMSMGVAAFILVHAAQNLREALDLFLLKTPAGLEPAEIAAHVTAIEGVADVHHIHLWSLDGVHHHATMHVVADGDTHAIKHAIREELAEHGITHVTLEFESPDETCYAPHCHVEMHPGHSHHHHHH